MDKKKIDGVLIEFGITPTNPSGEQKYSDQTYTHFEMMAESFGVKEPSDVLKALLDNNVKPYITQYVLCGRPDGDEICYTALFPFAGDDYDLVSFNGPEDISDRLLQHYMEQSLYACHKKYVDNGVPIPTHGAFHIPPKGSEGAIRHLVIDRNYTIRVHLHNINVERDLQATIH